MRKVAILPREFRVNKSSKVLRAEHSLVASAFHTVQAANARRILLVSAHAGDGKSRFARCIQRYASVVTDEPCTVVSRSSVRLPQGPMEHGYLWVDGLALLEGEGGAVLSPAVRASLDGAVLIGRGMATTRNELAECAGQLRDLNIPVLGGVWNAVECQTPVEMARAFREGLRQWPPQLPPGVFARQFRRSS